MKMCFTYEQKISAFKHIVKNVFNQPEDSPLLLALLDGGNNTHGPVSIVTLQDADISQLKYSIDGNTHYLEYDDCLSLCIFRDFIKYKHSIKEPISNTLDGWMSITRQELYEYYCSGYYPFIPPPCQHFSHITTAITPKENMAATKPVTEPILTAEEPTAMSTLASPPISVAKPAYDNTSVPEPIQ
jgi:hypothetical protein